MQVEAPPGRSTPPAGADLRHRTVLLVGMTLAVAGGFLMYVPSNVDGAARTSLLLLGTTGAGTATAFRLARSLQDRRLLLLGYVFLTKLVVTAIALRHGWEPELGPTDYYDYDAQRYFNEAAELEQANFNKEALPGVNYTGVLYVYGWVFRAFGHNVIAPALTNCLLALAATVGLVRVGYAMKPERSPTDWRLCLMLLIPEMIWFDAITARDGLVASLITVVVTNFVLWLTGRRLRVSHVVVTGGALGVLAIVRFPVMIPMAAAIAILAVTRQERTARKSRRTMRLVVVVATVAAAVSAPALSASLGSYNTSYRSTFVMSGAMANEVGFSENSVGRLLVADDPFLTALFLPVRLAVLVVAPLPNFSIDFKGIDDGSWIAWEKAANTLSSLIYIPIFALVLASTLRIKGEARRRLLVNIPFWTFAVTIALGTQLIVPRYRVMIVPMMITSAWAGRAASQEERHLARVAWYSALALGGMFFLYIRLT